MPLMIRFSAAEDDARDDASRVVTGFSLVLGLLIGSFVVIAGVYVGGELGHILWVIGASLPAILLQDTWRYVFLCRGRPRSAFLNDLVFCLLVGSLIVSTLIWSHLDAATCAAIWGVAAGGSALLGAIQAGLIPALRRPLAWAKAHRALAARCFAEFGVLASASQLTLWSVGAVSGLQQLGILRLGLLIFGPVTTIFQGVEFAVVSEAARKAAEGGRPAVRSLGVKVSAICAAVGLLWGVAMIALPNALGTKVVGPLWLSSRHILLPVGLYCVFLGVSLGPAAGIRGLGWANESLRVRARIAGLAVTLGVLGSVLSGAAGAAWGTAIAACLGAFMWWRQIGEGTLRAGDQEPLSP